MHDPEPRLGRDWGETCVQSHGIVADQVVGLWQTSKWWNTEWRATFTVQIGFHGARVALFPGKQTQSRRVVTREVLEIPVLGNTVWSLRQIS